MKCIALFVALVAAFVCVGSSDAFQVGTSAQSQQVSSRATRPYESKLFAIKKQDDKKSPEKRKVVDPLELFVAYATPWRNPNSIFVYMFVALYALGKYSEAKAGL
ncbi:expressed unknown protein [Seminavis robusta]|uniref:Uncharacterized protein n=1 Tax=Seminavis robusta TaxID=568900 RepID=A0A9N8DYF2_9STRA|nr:expressed unknown protein [Seminavis robusta]|eukprot:Sro368_g127870.1 n/a (105) ;mRNA; f:1067-1381